MESAEIAGPAVKRNNKYIAVCITPKKSQKFNWAEFKNACDKHGFTFVELSLEKPFDEQPSFDILLHKVTDLLAASKQNDEKADLILKRLNEHIAAHPEITVIDPIDRVQILLDRSVYYNIIHEALKSKHGICMPKFALFTEDDMEKNKQILIDSGIKFPVVSKSTLAQGCKSAHEMTLIFNEQSLDQCKVPCVVQSFINHNAVMHKVFVVSDRYYTYQRPSIKNFYSKEDHEPIKFTSSEVCVAASLSKLSRLDPGERPVMKVVSHNKICTIIKVIKATIGLRLYGFDIVIDNATDEHAVIDINVFPSYDVFPNFFEHLFRCIKSARADHLPEESGTGARSKERGLVNVAHLGYKSGIAGMNIK